MSTDFKFEKQGLRYVVRDSEGNRLGTVWNNGARTSYLRHWSYQPFGGVEGRTGSRRAAAESLAEMFDR